MKSLAYAFAATVALAVSYGASAQSTPLTREQVRAELVQLEQAGYKPEVADPYYPRALQVARTRVATTDTTGYGAQAAPVVQTGRATSAAPNDSNAARTGQ
jgi:hypothetical protein